MRHSLTHAQITFIGDLLNIGNDAVRTDYVGRGMQRSCVGFVVPMSRVAAVGVALATTLFNDKSADDADGTYALDDAMDIADGAAVDNMGLDFIVYFQSLTVAKS